MALSTVRDAQGNIYADMGSAQLRKIPSLQEYQAGVAAGTYSGAPRQLDPSAGPTVGANNQTYVGGYETGPAGTGNFATPSRSIAATPGGSTGIANNTGSNAIAGPKSGSGAFSSAISSLIQTGNINGQQQAGGQSSIADLRRQQASLEGEQFQKTTEFTPQQLRNLSPGQQAELRRQRVTALSGQLGNVQAAIKTLQDEEEAAKTEADKQREYSLDTLNTYLKYGVFDQLSSEEQAQLSKTTGLSAKALTEMGKKAAAGEPPELKEVGGNLYQLTLNPETGVWDSKLVQAKSANGGTGSGGSGSGSGAGGDYEALAMAYLNGEITAADIATQYNAVTANAVLARANEIKAEAEGGGGTTEAPPAEVSTYQPGDENLTNVYSGSNPAERQRAEQLYGKPSSGFTSLFKGIVSTVKDGFGSAYRR